MSYFEGIEKGDIVWDFNYNWGLDKNKIKNKEKK